MKCSFTKTTEGIEAAVGARVFCLIDRRPKAARPWLVWRVREKLDGSRELGGADQFRTLEQAKEFCRHQSRLYQPQAENLKYTN